MLVFALLFAEFVSAASLVFLGVYIGPAFWPVIQMKIDSAHGMEYGSKAYFEQANYVVDLLVNYNMGATAIGCIVLCCVILRVYVEVARSRVSGAMQKESNV